MVSLLGRIDTLFNCEIAELQNTVVNESFMYILYILA